ncbi:MAG: hypothetical protein DWP95_10145 [Proteobacteria bacterium]|nr:MAG: hypothetical protein DWP95_10145 [Pseudomonadota bacterium]
MAAMTDEVKQIQFLWDEVNYMADGEAKEKAFEKLVEQANQATLVNHNLPEALVWQGIVYSSYAGVKGGLGALGLAKKARKAYQAAIAMDGSVLNGSAYTSLGVLYYKVPGWPLGFGSDKKAEQYLLKGLALNPNGIDANYFYAEYLYEETDRLEDSFKYLLKAEQSKDRPQRPRADAGRREEIKALKQRIKQDLAD